MASRRSRLQIKPNIGGPKSSGSKPAQKTVDPKPAPSENSGVLAAKLANNPRKSAIVNPRHLKETDQGKRIKNETDLDVKKQPQQNTASDSNIILDSVPGINSLPKLSPLSETSTTNNEEGKSAVTSSDMNSAKEYSGKDGRKISAKIDSDHAIQDDKNSSSDMIKEENTDTTKSAIPSRRSRFPKVKPKVVDASKKRQRYYARHFLEFHF